MNFALVYNVAKLLNNFTKLELLKRVGDNLFLLKVSGSRSNNSNILLHQVFYINLTRYQNSIFISDDILRFV